MESWKSVAHNALVYLEARWRLLRSESKDIGSKMVTGAIMAVAALILAGLGLVLAVLAGTFWMAEALFHGQLAPAFGISALIILIGGGICVWRAMASVRGSTFFPLTRREFQRDRLWLHSQTSQTTPISHPPKNGASSLPNSNRHEPV